MFEPLSCDFDISRSRVVSRLTALRKKVLNTVVKNQLNVVIGDVLCFISPQNSTKNIGFFVFIDSYVYYVH